MTDKTLKEKVKKSLEDCASGIDISEERYFDCLSRAAIDTVFEHLMEHSEEMRKASEVICAVWSTMLTQSLLDDQS
jgi:hypothetical protein